MEMLAHNPEMARNKSLSPQKAKEFVSKNTGSMSYDKLPEKSAPRQVKGRARGFHRLSKMLQGK
jgi:hypothetical protein